MSRSISRDDFPPVALDADAIQKFAEIEVQWDDRGEQTSSSVLIRGLCAAEYHKDAAAPTMRQLRQARLVANITGGGRIKHNSSKRTIFIYGYSVQFGQANMARVADMCRAAYPEYDVTWSTGGY